MRSLQSNNSEEAQCRPRSEPRRGSYKTRWSTGMGQSVNVRDWISINVIAWIDHLLQIARRCQLTDHHSEYRKTIGGVRPSSEVSHDM
jgi:hypothetical protein